MQQWAEITLLLGYCGITITMIKKVKISGKSKLQGRSKCQGGQNVRSKFKGGQNVRKIKMSRVSKFPKT